jgi:hypothetical protein
VNGNRVGTYDPSSNITYDRSNQRIGEGNLLASLVVPSHNLPWGVGGYILGRLTAESDSRKIRRNNEYVEKYETYEKSRYPDWYDRHTTGIIIGFVCVLLYPILCLKFILSKDWLFGFVFVIFPLIIGLFIVFMRYSKSKKEGK